MVLDLLLTENHNKLCLLAFNINDFMQMYIQSSVVVPGVFPWWGITGNECNIGAIVPMTSAEGMINKGGPGHAPPGNFQNLSTVGCNLVQYEC